MEKNNSSLQLDNGKLEQNLANEQAKVEMLKHTLTCVYKCVSISEVSIFNLFEFYLFFFHQIKRTDY